MIDDFLTRPEQKAVDLTILQAMTARLDDYLTRDRLHWPMVVETPEGTRWPTMSIGGMLARLVRLRALADRLTSEENEVLQKAEAKMARARRWYPEAYRSHVIHELTSLLNSWRWFLDECYENLEACADSYPADARIRTNIQLLVDHMGEEALPAGLLDQIRALDSRLRSRFRSGEFIWESKLAPVFPPKQFWWLYGRPSV